jgi:glycosyltransferase involved in cell wall biosynthesis
MLVLAGNGPEFGTSRRRPAGLGIAPIMCVFTGYLDRSDLSLLYAISELFVFPSRNGNPGLVTIEAMLSGTPGAR